MESKIIVEKFIEQNISNKDIKLIAELRNTENNPRSKNYNLAKAISSNILFARYYRENSKFLNKDAILYLEQSIKEAKKSNIKNLEIFATVSYAFYLYRFRRLEKASILFIKIKNDIEDLDEKLIIEPSNTYMKLGFYFQTLNENKEANLFLQKAEALQTKKTIELGSIQDNIGLNYILLKEYPLADKYLKKALQTAKEVNDTLRQAKVLGNLGLLNHKLQNYDTAIKLLKEDISISEKLKNEQNTIYALVQLSKIYLEKKDIHEAEKLLLKAENYAKSSINFKTNEYEIEQLLLKIAIDKKDTNKELKIRRKLENIKDSIDNMDGPESIKKVNWMIDKNHIENKLIKEQKKFKRESLNKNILISLLVLLVIMITLVVYNHNKKRKINRLEYEKRISQLQLDKENSEKHLNETHKTLDSYKTYLAEKNDQINQLEQELEKVKDATSVQMQKRKLEINDLLKSHLMTDENWENFKIAYQEEHPDFYNYLMKNFETLTDSNLRLVILMSLQLSNQQISNLLGITVDGVKKAKQRLKKKLDEKYDYLFTEASHTI